MNPIPEVKPFNLAEVTRRNADFLVAYLTIAMGGVRPDEEQSHEISKRLIEHLTDSAQALDEIKRLYAVLEELQRRHMPLAGTPGAAVLCEGCSLHGAQVPWPCETYTQAGKALPERRP